MVLEPGRFLVAVRNNTTTAEMKINPAHFVEWTQASTFNSSSYVWFLS